MDLSPMIQKTAKKHLSRKDSVYVECREWLDKGFGNAYYSLRLFVNGDLVAISPIQYGYGDQYLHTSVALLLAGGYLPDEITPEPDYTLKTINHSLHRIAREIGFVLYDSKKQVLKKEMFVLP